MPISSLLVALAQAALARVAPATPAPPAHCAAPEYRQFDFFAGDWDTFDLGAPAVPVARNRVTLMLDGCALREVYVQNDGLRGESFSTYDAARHRWHQSWVTNRGSLLLMDGALEGNHLVFTGPEPRPDGTTALMRVTWWPEGRSVRERAERSMDKGTTWAPLFDIVFRPHTAPASRKE